MGSFKYLEDTAILLDCIKDSGFRGELAFRLQVKTTRFYGIQTGKFERFRGAMAFRRKIIGAGFSDATVVRQRLKK